MINCIKHFQRLPDRRTIGSNAICTDSLLSMTFNMVSIVFNKPMAVIARSSPVSPFSTTWLEEQEHFQSKKKKSSGSKCTSFAKQVHFSGKITRKSVLSSRKCLQEEITGSKCTFSRPVAKKSKMYLLPERSALASRRFFLFATDPCGLSYKIRVPGTTHK